MIRIAVKYRLDNIFALHKDIMVLKNYDWYIDENCEKEVVEFVNSNYKKFVYSLNYVVGGMVSTDIFRDGPANSKEIKFPSAKMKGRKGLNSRLYTMLDGNNLIICLLDLYKKDRKVESKVVNRLKELRSSEYLYKAKGKGKFLVEYETD